MDAILRQNLEQKLFSATASQTTIQEGLNSLVGRLESKVLQFRLKQLYLKGTWVDVKELVKCDKWHILSSLDLAEEIVEV